MTLDWLASPWAPGVSLAAVAGLEQVLSRRPPLPSDAARWKLNLSLFALEQAVLWLLAGAFTAFIAKAAGASPLALAVAAWPAWARVLLAIFALDAAAYAVHLASHAIPPLWRLHAVHHADPELDVTTSVRHHPAELVPSALVLGLVAGLLGLDREGLAEYGGLAFAVQVLAHARLRLPGRLGVAAGWLFVTPAIHAVHHSPLRQQTDSNYGQLLSIWDRLFGTFTRPPPIPPRFGLDGYAAANFQTIVGALAQPFRWIAR